MAVLGKRKSRSSALVPRGSIIDSDPAKKSKKQTHEPTISSEDYAAFLRSHFEAEYEPLSNVVANRDHGEESESEGLGAGSGSEWGGLSDDDQGPRSGQGWEDVGDDDDDEDDLDDEAQADPFASPRSPTEIQIVDHSSSSSTPLSAGQMSKRDRRRFLSSVAPSLSARAPLPPAPPLLLLLRPEGGKEEEEEEADTETASSLLKKDLELSRLLGESHLFSSLNTHTSTGASLPFSDRRARLAATDLRIRALGSRRTLVGHQGQKKMPLAQRRGIVQKAGERETKRRREARENGIVLERPGGAGAGGTIGVGAKDKRRKPKTEVAVDMPSVGRMRGAELKLSKKDIREVEGDAGRRIRSTGRAGRKKRR
ncbi:hypothetical protein MKZ38_001866 [Zalerion maritima]|uniref:Protein FAF1 n=1 Tax=Zalerion maritima TaxID=339359 RepID=A0AAD5WSV1_9PEZI|nr:hypothetical protein MKZ38_001866 [Zalerion maritima]